MNTALFFLLACGLVAANVLCGGFRVGYATPAYLFVIAAALLSTIRLRSIVSQGWPSRICFIVTTLCFGYIIGRAVLSPYPYLARSQLFLATAAVIVYFLSALYLTESRYRGWLVAVLLFLGMANGAVAAIQFFKAPDFMLFALFPRAETYGARASGFFLSPNSLAGFLEICFLMGLSMVWWGRWSIYGKILAGYAAAVCLGGIILTGSRGGYMSTAFGLLILLCISAFVSIRRLQDRGWLVLLGVGCVLVVAGWGIKESMNRNYLLQSRASSMTWNENDTRVAYWRAAIKQFGISPVTGTGGGTYLYYGRKFRADPVQTDPMVAHNDYLQLLAEYGIVGLVGIVLFLFEHLRNAVAWLRKTIAGSSRVLDTQSNSLALTIGAVSSVGAYIVHSSVDFNLQIPANALVMACVFGFLAMPARAARGTSQAVSSWMEKCFGALVPAMAVALAVLVVPRVPTELARERAKILDARWVSPETDVQTEQMVRVGLQSDPNDADLYALLGKALLAQARVAEEPAPQRKLLEEAMAAYRRASELAPHDVVYVLGLAQTLDAAKLFADAEAVYARALALDPNSGWVHWAYGVHFHLQGDLDKAAEEYNISAKLFFPPSLHGLTKIHLERQAAGKH